MKKKCSPFSIITMVVALAGLAVAVAALLDRRCCALCEDLEDEDLVEYLGDEEDTDDAMEDAPAPENE